MAGKEMRTVFADVGSPSVVRHTVGFSKHQAEWLEAEAEEIDGDLTTFLEIVVAEGLKALGYQPSEDDEIPF